MERTGFSRELEGFTLVGEVYSPDSTPCPAVCLCHGIPRGGAPDPSDGGYPLLAQGFAEAGFAALTFNFRGTGGSGGNFDIMGWTRDLETVLDYVSNLNEVEKEAISVMGFSAGAAVSAYTASRDPRVSSLVLCACPARFRMAGEVKRPQLVIDQFRSVGIIRDQSFPPSEESWLDGFERVKPIACIKDISPRPILIIHGAQDDVVDPQDAWALYEEAGHPKDILVIDNAGHRLRTVEEAVDAALSWLKRQMRPN